MAKIFIGTISFLGSVTVGIIIFIDLFSDRHYYYVPEELVNKLIFMALVSIVSSYLIITKFWKRNTPFEPSESSKQKSEINLLKKQIEISKLKKELDELGKSSNAN